MSTQPAYQCQVCGEETPIEVVTLLANHHGYHWVLHHLERKGGIIPVMTCPNCAELSHDLIFEAYQERIRLGLVPGFH